MSKYVVNKQFASSVDRSIRVMECAEAFGLGLEDKTFVVYDNLKLPINKGDIVYITGQSGSGKSLLLRELAGQMSDSQTVANIDTISLEERPLIDQVGQSMDDAIRILSAAGLNDAYLFIRKPSELSDGQLYRFRIAKLMESKSRVWVADEFGAVLDRTTAKLVAFNLQKQARRAKATVIVATTHTDLREELAPDLYVNKRYRDWLNVEPPLEEDDDVLDAMYDGEGCSSADCKETRALLRYFRHIQKAEDDRVAKREERERLKMEKESQEAMNVVCTV